MNPAEVILPKMHTSLFIPFMKSDDSKRMVWGYCTSEAIDSHGEIVEKEAIRDAWADYMEWANIREMHQPSAVGVTKEYQHDDFGTWIGVKVVDDTAWNKIKEEVYKGFSIGGNVLERSKNRIKKLKLVEISIVDRPANPDARIAVVKRDDTTGQLTGGAEMSTVDTPEQTKQLTNTDTTMIKNEETPNPTETPAPTTEQPTVSEQSPASSGTEPGSEPAETVENPNEPAAPADPGAAGEQPTAPNEDPGVDKADKTISLKKDAYGVIMLAGLIDHIDWLFYVYRERGNDAAVAKMEECMAIAMQMVQMEATVAPEGEEKMAGENSTELVKAMGVLAKAMEVGNSKTLEALTKTQESLDKAVGTIEDLSKRVKTLEDQPAASRPVATAVVEKNGDVQKQETEIPVDAKAARENLDSVIAKINEAEPGWKAAAASGDPEKLARVKTEQDKLSGELAMAKAAVRASGLAA